MWRAHRPKRTERADRGWSIDGSARAPVNDLRANRASLGRAAPARLGPQKIWPRPAIVVAATTVWAILMIRLTVTHYILSRVVINSQALSIRQYRPPGQ